MRQLVCGLRGSHSLDCFRRACLKLPGQNGCPMCMSLMNAHGYKTHILVSRFCSNHCGPKCWGNSQSETHITALIGGLGNECLLLFLILHCFIIITVLKLGKVLPLIVQDGSRPTYSMSYKITTTSAAMDQKQCGPPKRF